MRITEEQKRVLDGLRCERLLADKSNLNHIRDFRSVRGSSLVEYFKRFGCEEDSSGKTAYYVIKDADDDVLMFFSMKCGVLFDPLEEESETVHDIQSLVIILQALENAEMFTGSDPICGIDC